MPAPTYEPALYGKRRTLWFLFRLRRTPALELVYLDQTAPELLLGNDENCGNDFFKEKEGQRARSGPAYDSVRIHTPASVETRCLKKEPR